MLVNLSIRDVVLVERLDLSFRDGLCVLTGETGAGKSILLDALGLALGNRAETRLLRPGAEQAVVTAVFDIASDHPVVQVLAAHGITHDDELLMLRRIVGAEGRSRAFINDQPVSVNLLRRLGDDLVEIQGQFEQRGLLDAATHRGLLDASGGLASDSQQVAVLWREWRAAVDAHALAMADLAQARHDESFLRHAVEELDQADPKPGENETLLRQRTLLMNAEKLTQAISAATAALSGSDEVFGAEAALNKARALLDPLADAAGEELTPILEALDRAIADSEDAVARLASFSSKIDLDGAQREQIEERYFALHDLARKHNSAVEQLPALRDALAARLAAIDSGGKRLASLSRDCERTRNAFVSAAEALSAARMRAATSLDKAVNKELPPLKLDKAAFRTNVQRLPEADWGKHGIDRIAFEVSTNPGSAPGPLNKIASGGELARFLLALKVVLAGSSPARVLVFDEVDSGIGGATAHAVGERLARLTSGPKLGNRQILVVTHSPQVAARGAYHWRVYKEPSGKQVTTQVSEVLRDERREEIARMLSGAQVTDEARAAADKLMGAA